MERWLTGRLRTSHARFVVAFPALLFVLCNAPNVARLAGWFRGEDGLDWMAFIAYLAAGLALSVATFTLLAHRWTVKPAAVLLAATSVAAAYFISLYGVAIDTTMVQNALLTDATEVRQLLSARMVPYALLGIVLPAALILRAEITFAPRGRYLVQSLGILVASVAVALACLYSSHAGILRAGNVSNKYIVYMLVPVNVLYGTGNAAAKAIAPRLRPPRAEAPPGLRVVVPGNLLVVLAIGESSRQQSFSLYGYARRETNPVLKGIDGVLALNGVAKRASTVSALPEILEKQGYKLPTVVARAGIPTYCFVNYTLYDNCAGVGETAVTRCGHGGRCYDEDVLPLLEERLRRYKAGYEFVVLHLGGGSHGPTYGDRHPPEYVVFRPTCDEADVARACSRESLQNSYDNSIRYVDHVVGTAIRKLDDSGIPYVFIYLSDHGESLLEGGMLFHGVPPGVQLPEEQARIPLIVKASVPLAVDGRGAYRQPDVYDTVLDLFAIESPALDRAGGFLSLRDRPSR